MSARELEEWIIWERLEAEDERAAYEEAKRNVAPAD